MEFFWFLFFVVVFIFVFCLFCLLRLSGVRFTQLLNSVGFSLLPDLRYFSHFLWTVFSPQVHGHSVAPITVKAPSLCLISFGIFCLVRVFSVPCSTSLVIFLCLQHCAAEPTQCHSLWMRCFQPPRALAATPSSPGGCEGVLEL